MSTKHVPLRLGEALLDALNALGMIAHKSSAAWGGESGPYRLAGGPQGSWRTPGTLTHDPDLFLNGRTIISLAEYNAFQTVRRRRASPLLSNPYSYTTTPIAEGPCTP
ncbi:MAG: hypothetical protein M1499_02580, partial [Firmicutes bacterium]|nr:hypothetical protein [Bacillota bacterium]